MQSRVLPVKIQVKRGAPAPSPSQEVDQKIGVESRGMMRGCLCGQSTEWKGEHWYSPVSSGKCMCGMGGGIWEEWESWDLCVQEQWSGQVGWDHRYLDGSFILHTRVGHLPLRAACSYPLGRHSPAGLQSIYPSHLMTKGFMLIRRGGGSKKWALV